jgi:hypothetical protein
MVSPSSLSKGFLLLNSVGSREVSGGVLSLWEWGMSGESGEQTRDRLLLFYLSVFENVVREMMGSVTEVSAALIPLMKFHASTYLGLWHRLLTLESPHHLNDHTAE